MTQASETVSPANRAWSPRFVEATEEQPSDQAQPSRKGQRAIDIHVGVSMQSPVQQSQHSGVHAQFECPPRHTEGPWRTGCDLGDVPLVIT